MAESSFTVPARAALASAYRAARAAGHSCLCSEHILFGIACQTGEAACRALEAQGLTRHVLERELESLNGSGGSRGICAEISREAAQVLEQAALEAVGEGMEYIDTGHMLSAMLLCRGCRAREMMVSLGADLRAITLMLNDRSSKSQPPKSLRLLTKHGVDMTAEAASGAYDRLIGREHELERVMRVLCRRRKANPVLLGEAGVGKTAIAEGLAAAVARGDVPEPLKGSRVFSVDMAAMVAGTKYRGEFEERLRGVLDEAARCGNVIMFIDELHTVAGAGAAEGAVDAGNILKPALARGAVRIMGATTPAEYRRHIARDAALERRFQPIDVPEPDREATMAILRSGASLCRRHYGIEAGADILEDIERMCRRYLPLRRFPDKAMDVLDEAAALALTEGAERLDAGHVRKVVGQMSGLTSLWRERPFPSPEELERELSGAVAGQPEAVRAAAEAASSAMAFHGGRSRPRGAMLFAGPPGTGKTLLARSLARALFGGESAFIRIDMSEYREPHSVSRLMGAPPGYAGHGRGGLLTSAIGRRPFSVVLFDEAEKACTEALGLLLQILEEGRLTDSDGETADFRSAVVILTSNASPARRAGFGVDADGKAAFAHAFPPELLSRIDRVVEFRPLSAESLARVALLTLESMREELAAEGVSLTWDEGAAEAIALRERDARAVRAAVTEAVETPLARLILAGRKGPVRLTCDGLKAE